MKKLLTFSLIATLVSCSVYKPYIQVQSFEIPKGCKEIVFQGTLDSMKAVFTKNGILYNVKENGLETEEILIDEGTRAKYQILKFDGGNLKMIPFWGITDKVKAQIDMSSRIISGHSSSVSTESWDRAIYEGPDLRPSIVYNYGVQLARQVTLTVTFK
jgi:hypothetical protein